MSKENASIEVSLSGSTVEDSGFILVEAPIGGSAVAKLNREVLTDRNSTWRRSAKLKNIDGIDGNEDESDEGSEDEEEEEEEEDDEGEESFFFESPSFSKERSNCMDDQGNVTPDFSLGASSQEDGFYSPSLSPASVPSKSPHHDGEVDRNSETTTRITFKPTAPPSYAHVPVDAREKRHEAKWLGMLNNWGFTTMLRPRALKRRVRRGIPPSIRPLAWQRFAMTQDLKKALPDPRKVDTSILTKQVLDDIEKDIDRTYPEHDLFSDDSDGRGQIYLRSMLVWYASTDTEVGYCQGMSFIAGLILTYCTAEEGFYIFKHCMDTMQLRNIYKPGLVDLQRRLYVLTQLGWDHIEELWDHLHENNVDPMMYATEWFMTLFCRGFDFALSTRVVEIFMLEGYKILYRVAITILNSMKEELMESGFEDILSLIRNCNKTIVPAQILIDCFQWKFRSAEINGHEAEYDRLMKEKKEAEEAEEDEEV